MTAIIESVVEQGALAWLESLGWQVAHAPNTCAHISSCNGRETLR